MSEDRYQKFIEISAVVFAGATGYLIGVPLAVMLQGKTGFPIPLMTFVMGLLVGYRRRKSRVFFYFCLFSLLVLSTIISFSMFDPQGRPAY